MSAQEVVLFGIPVTVEDAMIEECKGIIAMKARAGEFANKAVEFFSNAERLQDGIGVLATFQENVYPIFVEPILDVLHQHGIGYDYDEVDYCKDASNRVHGLADLMDGLNHLLDELDDREHQEDYRREMRKESRGRVVGGGFSLGGALQAMLMAGAINTATGALHSIANGIGSMVDQNNRENKEHEILNLVREHLSEVVAGDLMGLYFHMNEVIGKEPYYTPDNRIKAQKIMKAVMTGRVPIDQVPEQLKNIALSAPYDAELILTIANKFGADDGLIAFSKLMGNDEVAENLQKVAMLVRRAKELFGENFDEVWERNRKDYAFLFICLSRPMDILTGLHAMLEAKGHARIFEGCECVCLSEVKNGQINFANKIKRIALHEGDVPFLRLFNEEQDLEMVVSDKRLYFFMKIQSDCVIDKNVAFHIEYDENHAVIIVNGIKAFDLSLAPEQMDSLNDIITYLMLRVAYGIGPAAPEGITYVTKIAEKNATITLARKVFGDHAEAVVEKYCGHEALDYILQHPQYDTMTLVKGFVKNACENGIYDYDISELMCLSGKDFIGIDDLAIGVENGFRSSPVSRYELQYVGFGDKASNKFLKIISIVFTDFGVHYETYGTYRRVTKKDGYVGTRAVPYQEITKFECCENFEEEDGHAVYSINEEDCWRAKDIRSEKLMKLVYEIMLMVILKNKYAPKKLRTVESIQELSAESSTSGDSASGDDMREQLCIDTRTPRMSPTSYGPIATVVFGDHAEYVTTKYSGHEAVDAILYHPNDDMLSAIKRMLEEKKGMPYAGLYDIICLPDMTYEGQNLYPIDLGLDHGFHDLFFRKGKEYIGFGSNSTTTLIITDLLFSESGVYYVEPGMKDLPENKKYQGVGWFDYDKIENLRIEPHVDAGGNIESVTLYINGEACWHSTDVKTFELMELLFEVMLMIILKYKYSVHGNPRFPVDANFFGRAFNSVHVPFPKSYLYLPNYPSAEKFQKKYRKAFYSYINRNVLGSGNVFLLHDDTVFGAGDEGFAITEKGVAFSGEPYFIPYEDIEQIGRDGTSIYVNGIRISLIGSDESVAFACELLHQIVGK